MLLIKDGVDWSGVDEMIVYASRVAEGVYQRIANVPVVITSLRDGVHSPGSKHYLGKAVDWRIHTVPVSLRGLLIRELQKALPFPFQILHEKIGTADEHCHAELDPL